MKIALVDDQREELDRLLSILESELPDAQFDTFPSGEAFLEVWKDGAYDLIVLDMFMIELKGIDVARHVRETDFDVRLVFCTTSNEFASESYEVGVNYYLHKPVSSDSIKRMLKMIRLDHYENNRFLRLPDGQRIVLRNIVYSEYHNHLITIHCKKGEDFQTRMSQTDWELLLAEYTYFYSCSKGIVVNLHEIEKQTESLFLLSDGSNIPISRRKLKEAMERYTSFRFEKLRKGAY